MSQGNSEFGKERQNTPTFTSNWQGKPTGNGLKNGSNSE
jgi:hypothetical protein